MLLLKLVAFVLTLTTVTAIPIMRMRLCIASSDPFRLQSQCVFCHNKKFASTARQCTGVPYLPANVTVEEGYCIIRLCRQQLPMIKPQPYRVPYPAASMPIMAPHYGMGTDELNQYDDAPYIAPKPVRPRPPALVTVGKPFRPGLMALFG